MDSSEYLPPESKAWLAGFLALNITAFAVITCLGLGSASLALSWAKAHWESLLILYMAILLTLIVGNLADPKLKAALVFLDWSEPSPISRVFTRYLPKKLRMEDKAPDPGTADPLPMGREAQKNLWCQLYRKHRTEPAVIEAGKKFLLAQELTWLSFVALILFGSGSLIMGEFTQQTLVYAVYLLIQYIAVSKVARTTGIRFFGNVLAVAETHKIIGRSPHHSTFARG